MKQKEERTTGKEVQDPETRKSKELQPWTQNVGLQILCRAGERVSRRKLQLLCVPAKPDRDRFKLSDTSTRNIFFFKI